MNGIAKSVIEILDEELLGFIINDTKDLIIKTQRYLSKNDAETILEIDRVWETVQNVLELDFMYSNHIKTKPKYYSDAMILTGELYVFHKAVTEEYNSNQENGYNKPRIIDELEEFMLSLVENKKIKRNYYFTEKDIQTYKTKLNNTKNG